MADSLPDYYPEEFSGTGILNRLSPETGILVIDGRQYRISPDLIVHTLATKFSAIESLSPKMPVGFGVIRLGDEYYIDEIWVLPSNHSFPERG